MGVAQYVKAWASHGGFSAYFRSIAELDGEAIMSSLNEHYAWLLRVTEGYLARGSFGLRLSTATLLPRPPRCRWRRLRPTDAGEYVPHSRRRVATFCRGTARLEVLSRRCWRRLS